MFTVQAHPEFKDEFIDGADASTRAPGLVPPDVMADATEARLVMTNDSPT
jgi:hypothetical protein